MLRFRRYRVFVAFAVIALFALYRFTTVQEWQDATAAGYQNLKGFRTSHRPSSGTAGDGTTNNSKSNSNGHAKNNPPAKPSPAIAVPQSSASQHASLADSNARVDTHSTTHATATATTVSAASATTSAPATLREPRPSKEASAGNSSAASSIAAVQGASSSTTARTRATESAVPAADPSKYHVHSPMDEQFDVKKLAMGGVGAKEAAPPLFDQPLLHWSRMPEHFPVPTASLIPLPTGKPLSIPTIQHRFPSESSHAKAAREEKLRAIKEAFLHTWQGYKENAWGFDELKPISGGNKNPFCSWAATLVDALDTLWIMGLEEEFVEALKTVALIDFTTTPRKDIPVFETTIRYLGGLLSAYDVSGQKYKVLLQKATELADVLMGAFDTPNRMPIVYYYWAPTFANNPHRASTRTVLAELGSLSMEFTRLAQLTKQPRYYDAIARITNELQAFQNETAIPGLWPASIDTSGCKKPERQAPLQQSPFGQTAAQQPVDAQQPPAGYTTQDNPPQVPAVTRPGDTDSKTPSDASNKLGHTDTNTASDASSKANSQDTSSNSSTPSKAGQMALERRQLSDEVPAANLPPVSNNGMDQPIINQNPAPEKVDCEAQGLAMPPGGELGSYGMGSLADSTYEYLPKQFMLLGGRAPQYRSMYEKAIDAANKHLLFRPMIKDEKRSILALGVGRNGMDREPDIDVPGKLKLHPEVTHLTCFAGGMWAIGAKIFGRDKDLEIAKKLTDGCVWAYQAHAVGVMPESMVMLPCPSRETCKWNESAWFEELDPYHVERERIHQKMLEAQRKEALAQQASLHEEARAVANSAAQSDSLAAKASATASAEGTVKSDAASDGVINNLSSSGKEAAAAASEGKPQEFAAGPTLADHEDVIHDGTIARRQLGPDAKADSPAAASRDDASLVDAYDALSADVISAGDARSGGSRSDEDRGPQPHDESQAANSNLLSMGIGGPVYEQSIRDKYNRPAAELTDHVKYAQARIDNERLAPGVTYINARDYLLRPEAIESVFMMYRITGDETWRAKGWDMWTAIHNASRTTYGYAALRDVTAPTAADWDNRHDSMESFWLAETLKYFYLLYSPPSYISLDEWVLNTEAHPFRRPK